jgi:putative transposase
LVDFVRVGFRTSERRACQVIGYHRKTYRYQSRAKDQAALRMRLRELTSVQVRYGYRRLHTLLRREGWRVNHKRVYRLFRLGALSKGSRRALGALYGPQEARQRPATALASGAGPQ